MLHAAVLLWVAGVGHLLHGERRHARDGLAARRLDPGRADRLAPLDPRARARAADRLRVRARSSRGSRSSKLPDANSSIVGVGRARRHRAPVWSGRRLQTRRAAGAPAPRARPGIESAGRGPGPLDGVRPRPARGDRGGFRADRGGEARALPDLRDAGRSRSSRRPASVEARRRTSSSACGSHEQRRRPDRWTGTARRVATLVSNRTVKPGTKLDLVWNGVTASGLLVPDGVYSRWSSSCARTARSRCRTRSGSTRRRRRSPSSTRSTRSSRPTATGATTSFTFHYTINEPAHAILLVRGDQVLFTRTSKQAGELTWNGRLDGRRARAPGRYVLSIAAQDVAGNRAKAVSVRDRADPLRRARADARSSSRRAAGSRFASRPTRRRCAGC